MNCWRLGHIKVSASGIIGNCWLTSVAFLLLTLLFCRKHILTYLTIFHCVSRTLSSEMLDLAFFFFCTAISAKENRKAEKIRICIDIYSKPQFSLKKKIIFFQKIVNPIVRLVFYIFESTAVEKEAIGS